jgi:hypothetical protein
LHVPTWIDTERVAGSAILRHAARVTKIRRIEMRPLRLDNRAMDGAPASPCDHVACEHFQKRRALVGQELPDISRCKDNQDQGDNRQQA